MQIELSFKNDKAILTAEYSQLGEEAVFATLNPYGNRIVKSIREKEVSTLPVLNVCLRRLRNATLEGAISDNRDSLLNFVDEAIERNEYCTPEMLGCLENYMLHSLVLWKDVSLSEKEEIMKAISTDSHVATKSEIEKMYKGISTKGDSFLMVSEEPAVIYMQVAYSLLLHTFRRGKVIKRCQNCGNIFIPSRKNNVYCLRKTDGKTCLELQQAHRQNKSHEKEPQKTHKIVYNRLNNRYKSHYAEEDRIMLDSFLEGYANCKSNTEKIDFVKKWDKETK